MAAWSFALDPYYNENLTKYFDDPVLDKMADIIDPYTYRDRLNKIPKLVIMASGDEFFTPDDSWAWFHEMKGRVHQKVQTRPDARSMNPGERKDLASTASEFRTWNEFTFTFVTKY